MAPSHPASPGRRTGPAVSSLLPRSPPETVSKCAEWAEISYLDGGHGAGDVEVLSSVPPGLHQGDTVGAADSLSCVLPRGDIDRSDDVRCVGIET